MKILLLLTVYCLLLLLTSQAFGAVAVDTSDYAIGDGVDTITMTYTVTGSNTLALCGTSSDFTTPGTSTVTFNGVGMTSITRLNVYANIEFSAWRMTGVSGTHDFVFTTGGTDYIALGCTTFTGVDSTTPVGTDQSATAPANISLTVPTNGMSWDYASSILDAPADCSVMPAPQSGGQTSIFADCVGIGASAAISVMSSYRTTSGAQSWSAYPLYWGQIGVPINPSAVTAVARRRIIQ